ncbi:NH-dependent NAD synthetase protein, partial [Marine Group I thaumarchaeote SCGC AAA799-D07]
VGNVGHFDVEVDAKFLLKKSKSVKQIRPHLDAEEEIGITYEEIDSILYCLIEKKLSVDKTIQKTKISRKSVEKIYQMYQNTQHKRILPERV